MIDKETVFIIGAGASKPYGYPTGKELRKSICKDPLLYSRGDDSQFKKKLEEFASIFFKSSTPSIDLFLARNNEYNKVGKFAIVSQIIHSEIRSKFHEDTNIVSQDWYTYLYEKTTHTLIKPESFNLFKNNKISFITFNYDRSLEQFIYESITNSFYSQKLHAMIQNKLTDIKDIMPFKIIHVYGKFAPLDWEEELGFSYGFNPSQSNIYNLLKNIKIVYEREKIEKTEIQKIIKSAERIFFLGFGFADENLEILEMPKILKVNQKIYGTAYDSTERELKDIIDKFYVPNMIESTKVYKRINNIFIENCDSLTLLRKYL